MIHLNSYILPSCSLAVSKLFRFIVGPEKQKFSIPCVLVATQSPQFERLVNGDFREASDFHVELENVEEETFVRFVQYAYTGRFDDIKSVMNDPLGNPNGNDLSESEKSAVTKELFPAAAIEDDGWRLGSFATSKKDKKGKKGKKEKGVLPQTGKYESTSETVVFQALGEKFVRSVLGTPATGAASTVTLPLGGPPSSNLFLTHARLFTFADYWGVERSRSMALRRLGTELGDTFIRDDLVKEQVVELVEYCCEDIRPEVLMELVQRYVAFKLPHLWENATFREIVGDKRELSDMLLDSIVKSGL